MRAKVITKRQYKKLREKYEVQPLPATAIISGITIYTGDHRIMGGKGIKLSFAVYNKVTLKKGRHDVRVLGSRPANMIDDWCSNDATRRQFARLAGIPIKELLADWRAARDYEKDEHIREQVRYARHVLKQYRGRS
jgi:hypothetical protein